MRSKKHSYFLALTIMLVLFSSIGFAGEITYSKRIYASGDTAVQLGTPRAISTVELTPKLGSFTDTKVQNLITFGVDQFSKAYFGTNFTTKVKLKIEKWDKNNAPQGTQYEYLTVNYSPFGTTTTYLDKSAYKFKNAYKIVVTIDSIYKNGVSVNDLPLNLYVESEIKVNRIYDFESVATNQFTFNTPTLHNIDCDADGINDEIELSWNSGFGSGAGMIVPEEYQLEWAFINDYGISTTAPSMSPTLLQYDFKHNSTRISTTKNFYRITTTFEHGYLIYRVRGIGKKMTNPSINIVGVWSTASETGSIASLGANAFQITQEHEKDKNWQYSATYAEEGKKKEVINYFDGSLRNRESVTKINSDKNTIVGQTIYDNQGRPALNVLPVPVQNPNCTTDESVSAIKYYVNFNQDDSTKSYSRNDFDMDASSGDSCSSAANGMSTISGASNYYSPANPNMAGYQGFVPDANKFPFTQIEYTPDNTGRIKRQSGVGSLYQLGNGHESTYLYGQPNQIQLDRLFGSEVGDAAHYKKNVVIDANGQVSTTYLDQEGRTIATSLAGTPPKNCDTCNTTRLSSLASESNAKKKLTVDLFAKNALGQSSLNTENVSNTGIEFASQLLVSYRSWYKFKYDVKVARFADPCLKANVCFDCVYDLDIKVTDECGFNYAKTAGNVIHKTIGKFTNTSNGIVFNTQCLSPDSLIDHEVLDSILLDPGNYTMSKILTVNKAAKDFYVSKYIDTTYNSCVRSLQSFINAALAGVDTSDCNISCETCAKSLQTINGTYYANVNDARDAFVAAGLGTELNFDFLLEECGNPCKVTSWCETTYEQLLLDVSPDGQYAQLRTSAGVVSPSSFPLSVLNTSNQLPIKSISPAPNWQNPRAIVNGNPYPFYLDEDGTRSIVKLIPNGTNYLPLVANTTPSYIKTDAVGGFKYTYPENLVNPEDFVAAWKSSWAKSLVQYHPEYCNYEACATYGKKQGTYALTSDIFDSKLINAQTFNQAKTDTLINANYLSLTAANNTKVADFFTATGNRYDPFAVAGSAYQSNLGTLSFNIHNELLNKFTIYQTFTDGTGTHNYSMLDMAAIAARCGTQYGVLPNITCMKFGTDFYPSTVTNYVHLNDSIRDREWAIFKNFYLSEKMKLQQRRADEYALKYCKGYNGCIGSSSFNPFASGMVNYGMLGAFFSSPFFDPNQPCSASTYALYEGKRKRFITPADVPSQNADELDYQYYLQTGQCPLAVDLQYLIGALAGGQQLMSTSPINLQTYPQFTQDLYNEVSGTPPTSFIAYQWKNTSISGNVATFEIINPSTSTTAAKLVLDLTGSGISSFNSIVGFTQLNYTGTASGLYAFDITAQANIGGTNVYKTIKGQTTIKITGCNFKFKCEPNDIAVDLSNLWSALIANNQFNSSNYLITGTFQPFITTNIKNLLGTTATSLQWKYNSSSNRFELWDAANPSKILVLKFNTFTPSSFNSTNLYPFVKAFSGIKSDNQNLFVMKGLDGSGAQAATIEGEVFIEDHGIKTGVEMGKCGLPDPITCQGDEYKLKDDLASLLKDVLTKKPFDGNNIDLTASPKYTGLLSTYFPPNMQHSESKYDLFPVNFGTQLKEQLYFNLNCSCTIIINHKTNIKEPTLLFSGLNDLTNFSVTGNSDANGDYYHFYAIGHYLFNGRSYTDTIFGESSCIPLKPCTPCADEVKPSCTACTDSIKINVPSSICDSTSFYVNYSLWKNGLESKCTYENGISPIINYGDGTVTSDNSHSYSYPGTYFIQLSFSNEKDPSACIPQKIEKMITVSECQVVNPVCIKCLPTYFSKLDSANVASGTTYIDTTINQYITYKTALNALAISNNWQPTDTAYVAPIPYTEFSSLGYAQGVQRFVEFATQFDPQIDNKTQLRQMSAFISNYGNFKDSKKEYDRYVRAINKYNQRVGQLGYGQTMQPIPDTLFYQSFYADRIGSYIDYLRTKPQLGQTTTDIVAFMSVNVILPNPIDPCALKYQQYLAAYKQFEANQQITHSCGEYKLLSPFYSYDEFVKNNLCCNSTALSQFSTYIQSFSSTTTCPGAMPKVTTCSISNVDVKTCEKLYVTYLERIKAFNASAYAISHNITLNVNLYPSFNSFLQAELCDCVKKYIEYLSQYISAPANSTLTAPVDIDHYAPCSIQLPVGVDSCKLAYEKYLKGVDQYNQYVLDHKELSLPYIKVMYKYDEFISLGLCNCVDKYLAFLHSIVNGTANLDLKQREILYAQFDLGKTCTQEMKPPCNPHMPIDTISSPPYTKYDNPCAKYLKDLAVENAQNAYQQYIDSITTAISSKYMKHCLGAWENYTATYDDKEYHFTLYYYDQAGNLIRTIPPEGIEMVGITSYTDPVSVQINNDRTFNHHTYTTSHRMATSYEYNSLNQLVRQNLPDHDRMNIWEITLPNGLHSKLEVSAIQMLNSMTGYMSGKVVAGSKNRGYLYQTNDGGNTWQRMTDLVASDLKKVQMIDSAGYAVGSKGIVLRTADYGNTWDMLNTYTNNNIRVQLNDLYFTSSTSGIIVGNNGTILKTTNSGLTFSSPTPSLPYPAGFTGNDITAITYDGSYYYITVVGTSNGFPASVIFRSNNAVSWSLESNIQSVHLNDVHFYSTQKAYAVGVDGNLIYTNDMGTTWQAKSTGTVKNFKQVYFNDDSNGLALLDSVSGYSQIYKTQDGGNNWTLLSKPGYYYNSLSAYIQNASGSKLLAVGKNGLAQRVIMQSGTPYGIIPVISSNLPAIDLTTTWSKTVGGSVWTLAAGTNGNLYYCPNTTATTANWTNLAVSALASDNAKNIIIDVFGAGANPAFSGAIVTQSGKLYSVFKANNSNTLVVALVTIPTGAIMADICLDQSNDRIYTFDNTSKKVYKLQLVSTSGTNSVSNINPANAMVQANTIDFQNNQIIICGLNGEIFTGQIGGSAMSGSWGNNTKKVTPVPLNDIQYSGGTGGLVYAVGNDGSVLQRQTSGDWKTLISGTYEKLNQIKLSSSTAGIIVGDNGALLKGSVTGITMTNVKAITNTTQNLYDLALKNDTIYVAGANGTMLYSPSISSTAPILTNQNTSKSLYGLSFKPASSQVYAVGDLSLINLCAGTTRSINKDVFTPPLVDVHFSDVNNGTVGANNFTLRQTHDGGATWKIILPKSTTSASITKNISRVWTINGNYALAIGAGNYLSYIRNNIASDTSNLVTVTSDLKAIKFGSSNVLSGYIGGTNRKVFGINLTPSTSLGYNISINNTITQPAITPASTAINAIHIFANGSFMAVGDNKFLRYNKGSGTFAWTTFAAPTAVGATTSLRDVYFFDDVNGYVVGDNGTILKSSSVTLNTSGYITALTWLQKSAVDSFNVNTSTLASQVNINAIEFTSRYNGIWGGKYNFASTATYPYVRLIRDESEMFSTYFWYDKLGRMVVSQNTKQFNKKSYSYTKYDVLGRIIEVGEKAENNSVDPRFRDIFGTTVNSHFNTKVIDDLKLSNWLNSATGKRREITRTYYDVPVITGIPIQQLNLRKRVSSVTFETINDNNDQTYDNATHYSYDIHGNVKTLLQDNPKVGNH